jgi:hypothetical protein
MKDFGAFFDVDNWKEPTGEANVPPHPAEQTRPVVDGQPLMDGRQPLAPPLPEPKQPRTNKKRTTTPSNRHQQDPKRPRPIVSRATTDITLEVFSAKQDQKKRQDDKLEAAKRLWEFTVKGFYKGIYARPGYLNLGPLQTTDSLVRESNLSVQALFDTLSAHPDVMLVFREGQLCELSFWLIKCDAPNLDMLIAPAWGALHSNQLTTFLRYSLLAALGVVESCFECVLQVYYRNRNRNELPPFREVFHSLQCILWSIYGANAKWDAGEIFVASLVSLLGWRR